LFEAICGYYGIEVGTYPNTNNNKEIYSYDNTLTGKQYIMYLAELFGGNAKIERDGSCSIIPLNNYTNIEINALTSKKFEVGDTYELSRICYDNGIVKYQTQGFNVINVDELPIEDIDMTSYYYLTSDMKYYRYVDIEGDYEWQETNDIKNTLYLKSNNIFITQQADIDNISSELVGFSVTNITCENRMDLSLDCWDIVTYSTGANTYRTFYDNIINFNGVAMGTVKVQIPLKTTEETTNIINSTTDAKIYTLRTIVNEQENTIRTVVREANNTINKTNDILNTVEGMTQTITDLSNNVEGQIAELQTSINGVVSKLTTTGGNNIFYYAKEFWTDGTKITELNPTNEANLEEYTDTEIQQISVSGKGYKIDNGVSYQQAIVKNDTYTISFSYKKLLPLSNVYVEINGVQYILDNTNWSTFVQTINVVNNTIDFKFVSDTDNALEVYDLLGNIGTEKEIWTQNPNEIRTDTVQIGKGIQVNSSSSNITTRIDNDGHRIYDSPNISTARIITEMTDKGIETEGIIAREDSQISGMYLQKVDNQVWISSLL